MCLPTSFFKAKEIQLLAGNMAAWNFPASFMGRWGRATELWLKEVRVLENSERSGCAPFAVAFLSLLLPAVWNPSAAILDREVGPQVKVRLVGTNQRCSPCPTLSSGLAWTFSSEKNKLLSSLNFFFFFF